MSTIKLNELAESELSLTDLIAKADANGLMTKTNVQKLSNLIGAVSTSGMKAAIESTSPSPTEDGLYPCTESGTYTNFGGEVVDITSQLVFISVSATQTVFDKVVIPLSVSVTSVVEENGTDAVNGIAVYKNNQDGFKYVNNLGKNLFNKLDLQTNKVINSSGNIVSTSNLDDVLSNPINIIEGETYTVSGYAFGGNMNKFTVYLDENDVKVGSSERIPTTSSFRTNYTFTVPNGIDAKKAVISVSYHQDTDSFENKDNLQLEANSQFTDYQAYISNVLEIDNNLKAINTNQLNNSINNSLENSVYRTTYNLPTEITTLFSNYIKKIGTEFETDYNWNTIKNSITGITYYVDPTNGNDSNDGSELNPFKSIDVALSQSDANIIMLKPELYLFDNSWQGQSPQNDLKVLIWGTGFAEITTALDLSFSLSSGQTNTYEASSVRTIGKVVDKSNLDEFNVPKEFSKVFSIASVESTANSFYYNSTTDILYVHTFDDRSPDTDILSLFASSNGTLGDTNNSVYIENCNFYGGSPMISGNTDTNNRKEVVFNNCEFSYATSKDGIFMNGYTNNYFYECQAHYNLGDGFNYNGFSFGFEWQSKGYYNGNLNSNKANNGSTGHADCRVLRIKPDFSKSRGKSIQDVENTVSYTINANIGESLLPVSDVDGAGIGSNSIQGGTLTKMYLIDCNVGGYGYKINNFNESILYIKGGNILESPRVEELGSQIVEINKIIDISV